MFLEIPLSPVPVQKITADLNGQETTITLIPRLGNLYASVEVDGLAVVRERICLDAVPLINDVYRGLNGDLYFIDTAGRSDPKWPQLGSRHRLVFVA